MDFAGDYSGFTSLHEKDQQNEAVSDNKKQANSIADAFAEISAANNNKDQSLNKLDKNANKQTSLLGSVYKAIQINNEQQQSLLETTRTGNKTLLANLSKITDYLQSNQGSKSSLLDSLKDLGKSRGRPGVLGKVASILGPVAAAAGGIGSLSQLGQTRGTDFFGDQSTGLLGSRAAGYLGSTVSGAEIGGTVAGPLGAAIGGGLGLGAAAVQDYLPQISHFGQQTAEEAGVLGKNVWQTVEQATNKGIKTIEDKISGQAVSNLISTVTSSSGKFVESLATGAKDLLSGLFDWILNSIPSLSDIKQGVTSAAGSIGNAASAAASGIGRAASSVGGAVSDAYDRAVGNKPMVPNYTPGQNSRNSRGGLSDDEVKRREQQSLDYFIGQGWTKEQAAGITASIKTESNFNEKAVGDGGAAYGLSQWHPDRQGTFNQWSHKDIKDSSFAEQLAHIQYELNHGEKAAGDKLRRAKTAKEAGATFSTAYERPRDTAGNEAIRGAQAERYAQNYQPSKPEEKADSTATGIAANNDNKTTPTANTTTVENQAVATTPPGTAPINNDNDREQTYKQNMADFANSSRLLKQKVAQARQNGATDKDISDMLGPGYDKDGNNTDPAFNSPSFKAGQEASAKAANNNAASNPVASTPPDATTMPEEPPAATAVAKPVNNATTSTPSADNTALDQSTQHYLNSGNDLRAKVAQAKAKGLSDDKIANIIGPGYDKDGNLLNTPFNNNSEYQASLNRVNSAQAMPPPSSVGTSLDADQLPNNDDSTTTNNTAPVAANTAAKKPRKPANQNQASRAAANSNTDFAGNGLGIGDIFMHISTGGLLLVNSGATA